MHCKQSSALFLFRLRMTLPRIKENLEFKNKMPVNFLTDWHYACWTAFAAAPEEYASILRKMQQRRLQRSLLENGLRILHSPRSGNKKELQISIQSSFKSLKFNMLRRRCSHFTSAFSQLLP
ncbi:hypothetical protein [Acinetobacter sp.]|uniref:hypothetical protein n=1 Tax=Acinetobacter sp. TaxID=472 RepID=UPI002FC84B0F